MPVQCYKCGFAGNRDIARFCRQCGASLTEQPSQCGDAATGSWEEASGPPGEAMTHLNWAKGMILGIEEDDPTAWRQIASESSIAIEKAAGNFPAAHATLGLAMIALGDTKRARREFNMAIEQDDCNVLARAMLILMDLDSLGTSRLPLIGEWTDFIVLGIGAVVNRHRVQKLRRQIDDLVPAFRESLRRSANIRDWMSMSELMLQVHDAVQEVATPDQRNCLAQQVIDAEWHTIEIPADLEQEVAHMRSRAQARIGQKTGR